MGEMLKDLRETIEYLAMLLVGSFDDDALISFLFPKLIKLCFFEELLKRYTEAGIEAFKTV